VRYRGLCCGFPIGGEQVVRPLEMVKTYTTTAATAARITVPQDTFRNEGYLNSHPTSGVSSKCVRTPPRSPSAAANAKKVSAYKNDVSGLPRRLRIEYADEIGAGISLCCIASLILRDRAPTVQHAQ
jgi:hypothetical protein